jgi:hypothetical protein
VSATSLFHPIGDSSVLLLAVGRGIDVPAIVSVAMAFERFMNIVITAELATFNKR